MNVGTFDTTGYGLSMLRSIRRDKKASVYHSHCPIVVQSQNSIALRSDSFLPIFILSVSLRIKYHLCLLTTYISYTHFQQLFQSSRKHAGFFQHPGIHHTAVEPGTAYMCTLRFLLHFNIVLLSCAIFCQNIQTDIPSTLLPANPKYHQLYIFLPFSMHPSS